MTPKEADKPKYWEIFFNELLGENDRVSAIVGAAAVEGLLRRLIEARLEADRRDEFSKLLNPDKALGSFIARARTVYCLGLIKKEEFEDIKTIAKIRNRFAHRILVTSFEDKEVIKECNTLRMFDVGPYTPKEKYVYTCANLALRIKEYAGNL